MCYTCTCHTYTYTYRLYVCNEILCRISSFFSPDMAPGGVLEASLGGAAFSLDVTIGTNTQLCVTLKLATMAITLDGRPLVELVDNTTNTGSFTSDGQNNRRFLKEI